MTRARRESRRSTRRGSTDRASEKRDTDRQWAAESGGPPRGKGSIIGPAGLAVVIAVVLSGVGLGAVAFRPHDGGAVSASTRLVPTATASVARTPSASSLSPFVGSPVEKWAIGSAGLIVPAARQIGSYTPDQTSNALRKTRAFVRAANLAPTVVYGGDLGPVTKMLDPASVAALEKAGRKPTAKNNMLVRVTRFDPRLLKAQSHVVKVSGAMRARTEKGRLAVDFDYAFVYALKDTRTAASRLVSVRRSGTLLFSPAHPHSPRVGQAFWSTGSYLNSGGVCAGKVETTYLRVVFDEATAGAARPKPAHTINPLDVAHAVPDGVSCYHDSSGL